VRRVLLWAARNRWLAERIPRLRFVRRAVRRFMPGETLDEALAAAEHEREAGIGTVFTFLGENLTDAGATGRAAAHYHTVLDRVAERGLSTEISVKLTHLGLDVDPGLASEAFDGLAEHAERLGNWAWIDMEGSAYTDRTVEAYAGARERHEHVGLCLQAYLRRTPADIERLEPLRPAIRLVKGAYDEPSAIVYRGAREVDAAYLRVGEQLLRGLAEGRMSRFIAATHDVDLIEGLTQTAERLGLPRRAVEVQMLYGIRADQQRRLHTEGYEVRSLIAYGQAWYAWYLRRLAERPANVVFALRQLVP
jgi:proline dehydrogenase